MGVDRPLMIEQARLIDAVRDRHDIHITKFGSAFTPITVCKNVMTPDFAAGFDFAPGWHRPMKKRIESSHAQTGRAWLDVLEESREAPDNFSRVQVIGHATKFVQ